MNSKTYFNILGIAPTTDENVIKKAYRKQAFKYHPDRNPSHEANEKFIEITEAYENLLLAIGQAKKQPDNGVPKGKATSATQPREQDFGDLDERLRKARFRYEFIKRKENERAEEYYQSLIKGKKWNAFRIVLFASTILSVLLFADYLLLPKRQEVCTIIKANVDISYNGFGGEDVTPVIFNDNHKVWFPTLVAKKEKNNHFYLIKTRLFQEVKSIQYLKNGVWHEVVPNYSFIWIFPVIPLVLLFPLFTYFIKQKSFQFMLCFNLSTYAIPLLIVFTLLSNNRGWHLLTLGLY